MIRRFHDRWTDLCVLTIAVAFIAASASGAVGDPAHNATIEPLPAATPTYSGYKGVQIGMSDAEARKLLGDPKEKSDGQDYFVFSDKESAQIVYDSSHKVTTISVTYIGKSSSIPTPTVVFGEDVQAKSDGSISKTVQYAKDGFSVTYYRTPGDDPIIMVTMQKLQGQPG